MDAEVRLLSARWECAPFTGSFSIELYGRFYKVAQYDLTYSKRLSMQDLLTKRLFNFTHVCIIYNYNIYTHPIFQQCD